MGSALSGIAGDDYHGRKVGLAGGIGLRPEGQPAKRRAGNPGKDVDDILKGLRRTVFVVRMLPPAGRSAAASRRSAVGLDETDADFRQQQQEQ